MRYDKLVRDKIPEIIKQSNKTPITHIATDEEFQEKLKQKLLEETNEFLEDPNIEELADILEVIHTLCDSIKISFTELEEIRKSKQKSRGAFKKRIILDEIR